MEKQPLLEKQLLQKTKSHRVRWLGASVLLLVLGAFVFVKQLGSHYAMRGCYAADPKCDPSFEVAKETVAFGSLDHFTVLCTGHIGCETLLLPTDKNELSVEYRLLSTEDDGSIDFNVDPEEDSIQFSVMPDPDAPSKCFQKAEVRVHVPKAVLDIAYNVTVGLLNVTVPLTDLNIALDVGRDQSIENTIVHLKAGEVLGAVKNVKKFEGVSGAGKFFLELDTQPSANVTLHLGVGEVALDTVDFEGTFAAGSSLGKVVIEGDDKTVLDKVDKGVFGSKIDGHRTEGDAVLNVEVAAGKIQLTFQ
ncbi:hypothetical protein EDD86DRAFT_245874 [Gorgonomyces haynaldii]|nr:hypothetical protein EDD86DRAFT_245874 [Gorgonomyces haynaldii]